MNEMIETSKPKKEIDRVTLKTESRDRLDSWITQLEENAPGIKINRSQIVEWLIGSHSETLSKEELRDVKERYFDEVQFASWLLNQLKQSRDKGERKSIEELLSTYLPAKTKSPKTRSSKAMQSMEGQEAPIDFNSEEGYE